MKLDIKRAFPLALFVAVGLAAGAYWAWKHVRSGDRTREIVARESDGPESLRDMWGNLCQFDQVTAGRTTVLAFFGVDCTRTQQAIPSLKQFASRYHPGDVAFVAVYPHRDDTLERAAGHACANDLPFAALIDHDARLAAKLGVPATPAVCIVDESGTLRFCSGLGSGQASDASAEVDRAKAALDAVLADLAISVEPVAVQGTPIDRFAAGAAVRDVTYSRDVAPILQQRCQGCHRAGQTAPFELQSYDDAVRWSSMIREVVSQRRMPPWHADPRYGKFSNSHRLTAEEVETVVAWVDAGTPPGDASDSPTPVPRSDDWIIGQPDLVLDLPAEFRIPAEGTVLIDYLRLDDSFASDLLGEERWVTAAELRPSDPALVHHLALYLVPPGEVADIRIGLFTPLTVWVPGTPALNYPVDTALRVLPGSTLLLETHHNPIGKAGTSRISLGLRFADSPPKRELLQMRVETKSFRIPPGAPHHRADAEVIVDRDVLLHGLLPHMHYRGKDCTVRVEFPGGRVETLLMVPRYDFNWQICYLLEKPLALPRGTRLVAAAHWDNSALNPNNPDPRATIVYGQQSTDEMMGVGLYFSAPRGEAGGELADNSVAAPTSANEDLETLQQTAKNSNDVDSHLQLAGDLRGRRDFRGARSEYQAALALDPRCLTALVALAQLDIQDGELAQAEERLRTAVSLAPNDYGLRNDFGVLLVRRERPAEAEACFRRAIELEPHIDIAHANLALALLRLERFEDAEESARQAIARNSSCADAYLHLGLTLTRLKRFEEAKSALTRAATLRPQHADTVNALGSLALEEGHVDEALQQFDAALNLYPQFAEARVNRGLVLARRGDLELALTEFEAAIRARPELAEPHFYAGLCRAQQRDAQGAVTAYRRALERRPAWSAARNNLAWILATHPDDHIRDGAEALTLCDLAPSDDNTLSFGTLDTLAAALAETGQFDRAAEAMQRAIQLGQGRASPEVLEQMRSRQRLYEADQSYRDTEAW